ncbi:Protein SMG8 [Chionoecetes opilio]|uniref:Nonsense-mediated mRNA decay factor SMG8 n=1 Tax=Chionoecetes opilio TaxID=41210 RepID=A0A8J5D1Z5_CHIOP|nr:Protein SMG8 [Chionoecetes opilio]
MGPLGATTRPGGAPTLGRGVPPHRPRAPPSGPRWVPPLTRGAHPTRPLGPTTLPAGCPKKGPAGCPTLGPLGAPKTWARWVPHPPPPTRPRGLPPTRRGAPGRWGTCANSLFALPNNQAYVYIMEEEQETLPAPPLISTTLHHLCTTLPTSSTTAGTFSHLSLGGAVRGEGQGGGARLGDPPTTTATTLSNGILSGVATERKRNLGVVTKSFSSIKTVPRASVWFDVANRIYNFFIFELQEKDGKSKQCVCCSHERHVNTSSRSSMSEWRHRLADRRAGVADGRATSSGRRAKMVWRTQDGLARSLPVMAHSSAVTYVSFCNCGRRQGQREDPFSTDTANHVFYAHLSETYRGIIRQPSTTEYLPGMLSSVSPPGLLPQWSSWALTCLGPSSLYSHNAGICDQPGFLPGTNFLLPWDVTVKIEDRDRWPAIADTLGKKALLLKNKKNKCGDLHEFSVKIFLGVEYECRGGHRFMLASPDRHLKASPTGLVKDNATKIANADMPLYFPCPCSRSGSGIMNGQLIRLHVVTPKAPVNVTLTPQVQPGPDPTPKFIPQPQTSLPVKLSASAYWVLRLPYAYVGDQGPYYPPDPRQPTPPSFARLAKGCYGISQGPQDV